jgi:hypothetical protein
VAGAMADEGETVFRIGTVTAGAGMRFEARLS